MRDQRTEQGFTLIELMIVVLIISILVAIAIPVFGEARENAQRRACYSNERVVEGAYNQYISTVSSGTALADYSQLMAALIPNEISKAPACPEGGSYTWTANTCTCSIHGNYHDH